MFFFHVTKQGDSLSLTLFILFAEVLSRDLNSLIENGCIQILACLRVKLTANTNHLAYADDIIIFSLADNESLEMIMNRLVHYEAQYV